MARNSLYRGSVDVVRHRGAKRRRVFVSGVAAAVLVVGLGLGLWRSSAAAAAPAVDRQAVWTARVQRGDLVRQVQAQGTLVPEKVQWLSAPAAALVARILVQPGAQVEPDTVVVVLENSELELAALEAERQAASAEAALIALDVRTALEQSGQEANLLELGADLREAERRADVADQLAADGLVSSLDHGVAVNKARGLGERVAKEKGRLSALEAGRRRQLAAQRAEIARLKEIAEFRRAQLAALEVRAGASGVVQDVPLENGQWVAIGTLLAKVAEPDRLKAELRVAEADAKDVHKGMVVRFAAGGGVDGRVSRVDPAVVGGSVRIEVALQAPLPEGVRADQTVSAAVAIETLENVLFVTRPAGAPDGTTTTVYRLAADGSEAARVSVVLGRGSAREIEVVGGLAEGDEIVVSDVSVWEAAPRVRLK